MITSIYFGPSWRTVFPTSIYFRPNGDVFCFFTGDPRWTFVRLFTIYYLLLFWKSAILLCTAGRATFKNRQFDNEGMRNVLSYRTIFSSNVTCNIRFALKWCQIVATVVSHCAQLCYYVWELICCYYYKYIFFWEMCTNKYLFWLSHFVGYNRQ